MNKYESLQEHLSHHQFTWLITGVAGFIGSNLLEMLLKFNQKVIGIDNFITGYQRNLHEVLQEIPQAKNNFTFYEGDICNLDNCKEAIKGVDYVLHQAALGSVPRSIKDPISTNKINIDGFLNMLLVAKDCGVKRFIYASSSSVYGDSVILPKQETQIGKQLSPYAVTKYVNELYAGVFSRCYGIEAIGLRYFNVFGKRQDPNGAYAAVIPLWIKVLLKNEPVFINGDGETTRDFCYIENVVQANILAALIENKNALNEVYNIAVGEQTTLNALFNYIKLALGLGHDIKPVYRDFRDGDIRHSLAGVSKARRKLGYEPKYRVNEGLNESIKWYKKHLKL